MASLAILASSIDSSSIIRIVLFIMVMIAIGLLLAGSVIAIMTFYKYR
jgi:hypothetical protein